MRFVADAMLGRLARWMRFIGYDVLYFRDIEDSHLVRIARAEGRILLTRDRQIPKRFKIQCLLINSEQLNTQLQEVLSKYPPPVDSMGMRCLECNEILKLTPKSEVASMLPEYIRLHRHRFYTCPCCGRVYWEGTHTKRMRESLNEMGIRLSKE